MLIPSVAATLLAGAALAVPATPSGPPVRAGRPAHVPGAFDAIAAAPDGSLRAATPTSYSEYANETVTWIKASGKVGRRVTIFGPQRGRRSQTTAFTPTGAVTAYQSVAHHARRVLAVHLDADGAVSRPRLLSTPGYAAEPAGVVGGGGAAAVLFFEHIGDGAPRLKMAFQPAGSSHLGAAQVIDDGAGGSWNDAIGASGGVSYDLVLGPSGGAVIAGPGWLSGDAPGTGVRIRRIAPDGGLGPWIAVGDGRYGSGRVAVAAGDDGTVAIAMAMSDLRGEASQVLTTSLPPGAGAVTPIQTLYRGGVDDYESDNLSIAMGPGNQTEVTTAAGDPVQTEVFTGPAGALTRTGVFDTPDATGTQGTVTADGGTTVVWSRISENGSGSQPIVATHRPPGGTFSKPHVVARTRFKGGTSAGIDPQLLIPLTGGDAALGYYDRYSNYGDDGFKAYVVRLTQ